MMRPKKSGENREPLLHKNNPPVTGMTELEASTIRLAAATGSYAALTEALDTSFDTGISTGKEPRKKVESPKLGASISGIDMQSELKRASGSSITSSSSSSSTKIPPPPVPPRPSKKSQSTAVSDPALDAMLIEQDEKTREYETQFTSSVALLQMERELEKLERELKKLKKKLHSETSVTAGDVKFHGATTSSKSTSSVSSHEPTAKTTQEKVEEIEQKIKEIKDYAQTTLKVSMDDKIQQAKLQKRADELSIQTDLFKKPGPSSKSSGPKDQTMENDITIQEKKGFFECLCPCFFKPKEGSFPAAEYPDGIKPSESFTSIPFGPGKK